VPVSVIGTFAVLYLLGFSINTLTLFGLVLAIGNCRSTTRSSWSRTLSAISPRTYAARGRAPGDEGSVRADHRDRAGALRGIRADAFLTASRDFLQTVSVTIAISTVISAINSLTLSPALAAKLLKSHERARRTCCRG